MWRACGSSLAIDLENYPNDSLGLKNLQHQSVRQASSSKCFKVKTCSKSQIHVHSIYACACMCRRNTQHQITAKAAAKFLQNKPTNTKQLFLAGTSPTPCPQPLSTSLSPAVRALLLQVPAPRSIAPLRVSAAPGRQK